MVKKVLFICTGNFYRSRFAEAVFNFHSERRNLPWKAFSRGLAIHWAEGSLSPYTAAGLAARQIPLTYTGPTRVQLTEKDFAAAEIYIALDRQEHLPMIQEQFPAWSELTQYWEVPDLPMIQPEVAFPAIESHVLYLLDHLPK